MRIARHLYTSLPLLLIGLAAIGFVVVSIVKEHGRTRSIDAEIARQEEMVAKISRENDALTQTISYLESEEAQKFSAQQLGYQEVGDHVVNVRGVAEAAESIEEQLRREREEVEALAVEEELVHWQVWKNVFF